MTTQEAFPDPSEIHEFYVSQINALIASDREDVIPSLTAEYERINADRATETERAA